MGQYHNKLVMSQNIPVALKLAEALHVQDKVKTKDFIVTELLKI